MGDRGSILACVSGEYTEEDRDVVTKEGQYERRIAKQMWFLRLLHYSVRLMKYGEHPEKGNFYVALVMLSLALGFPLLLYLVTPTRRRISSHLPMADGCSSNQLWQRDFG